VLKQVNIAASDDLAVATRKAIILDGNGEVSRTEQLLATIDHRNSIYNTTIRKTNRHKLVSSGSARRDYDESTQPDNASNKRTHNVLSKQHFELY
jgi:hypothetical protein